MPPLSGRGYPSRQRACSPFCGAFPPDTAPLARHFPQAAHEGPASKWKMVLEKKVVRGIEDLLGKGGGGFNKFFAAVSEPRFPEVARRCSDLSLGALVHLDAGAC